MKAGRFFIAHTMKVLASLVVVMCLNSFQVLATSVSQSWYIELVTFSEKSSVQSFIDRLAQKGFHTEVVSVDVSGVERYRTRTRPFSSFASAEAFRQALADRTNLHNNHLLIRGFAPSMNQAWSIDLLRFADQSNASSFVARLHRKGFEAAIIQMDMAGRTLYQTQIQALPGFEQALAYRQELKQHTNISSTHLQIISPTVPDLSVQTQAARAGSSAQLHIQAPLDASDTSSTSVVTSQSDSSAAKSRQQVFPPTSRMQRKVQAQVVDGVLPDWHIYGSNTIRSDVYNSKGNLAATPYRFSHAQTYDELNLNMDRVFSPFHRITGQISGLTYNDSQYRSQFPGFVLERVNLRQENGEFFIPYRAEAGDFFAFQSYRTIQRSLKGGRIEFQPSWGGADFHHSIELFSGAASPAWDTFQYKDDFSTGGSWLVQHPVVGSLAANLVLNHKQANGLAQPGLRQRVGSLAWEKRAGVLGQKMVLEAEWGRFVGDHPLLLAGKPNAHRQGNGYFAQISGSPDLFPQLSYRLRGEAYEQDYSPNGASIQSDRNSQEAYLTWRTATGLAFSPRFQHYHTGWQTNNPTDTITYGGTISGMIPVFGGISGSIGGFGSDVESRDLATNTMAKVVNANLSMPVTESLSVRGGFYYANNNNKNNALGLNVTRQYSGAIDYRLQWQGISGTVSIGSIARRMDQQGIRWWEGNPTFNANLVYGRHQLSLALSKLDQGSVVANGGVDTMTAGLNYRYTQPKYTLGLDANWYDRQPDNAGTVWTNAWRVGAYITYNFDKPVVKLAMATPETASDVSLTPSIERMLVDISRLTPGMDVKAAKAIVAGAGMGEPTDQAGFLVWYAQIFRDMSENQRLALEVQAEHVARSAIIIDFIDPTDIAGMRTSFERMRRQLLSSYGQPDTFFDQGDFVANLGIELAAGRFIRVMQWKREGGILRFGIPRRLDGKVRMELQFAHRFTALKDTLWSLEAVQ